MSDLGMRLGRKFARLATNAVVGRPGLWRAFRGPLRRQFDHLAPRWDAMRSEDAFTPLEQALAAIPSSPARVLDLGTGTGLAAFLLARRFPQAEVTGVDLSDRMIEVARRNAPLELGGRVRFEQADAARLPFDEIEVDFVEPERDPALAKALSGLPPRRRLIVFLRYFADLDYATIAEVCEIEEGTVAATLAQARQALASILDEEGVRR